MTIRMRTGLAAVAGACCLGGFLAAQDDPPKQEPKTPETSTVMADKLRFTQQLLTSLAKEDFPVLENSAQELRRIANEQWQANPSETYRSRLQTFWTTLEGIEAGAQRQEIEEATLAYMQMTLACVRCHKELRRPATP